MPDHQAAEPEFAAVAAALRKLCGDPLAALAPDTRLDELPGMDSLRVLHVIAMMEDGFGIEIDVAALDRLHSVQDIVASVRAARAPAAPYASPGARRACE